MAAIYGSTNFKTFTLWISMIKLKNYDIRLPAINAGIVFEILYYL